MFYRWLSGWVSEYFTAVPLSSSNSSDVASFTYAELDLVRTVQVIWIPFLDKVIALQFLLKQLSPLLHYKRWRETVQSNESDFPWERCSRYCGNVRVDCFTIFRDRVIDPYQDLDNVSIEFLLC